MSAMASFNRVCVSRKLHSNILFHSICIPFGNIITDNPLGYIRNESVIYIINIKDYDRYCRCCNVDFIPYFYGTMPDVRVSFDGETDLPIVAKVHNIKYVIRPRLYDVPRFGVILHEPFHYSDNGNNAEFILYLPPGNSISQSSCGLYFTINDTNAICCVDIYGGISFVNTDCQIILPYVVYSKAASKTRFDIGNGHLECIQGTWPLKWSYTNAAPLKTKPAASVAE